MRWRYNGGDDPSGRRSATCIDDESITYYGEWGNGQPNGFGAITQNHVPIQCGYFHDGELVEAITPEEYERKMNAEQVSSHLQGSRW